MCGNPNTPSPKTTYETSASSDLRIVWPYAIAIEVAQLWRCTRCYFAQPLITTQQPNPPIININIGSHLQMFSKLGPICPFWTDALACLPACTKCMFSHRSMKSLLDRCHRSMTNLANSRTNKQQTLLHTSLTHALPSETDARKATHQKEFSR